MSADKPKSIVQQYVQEQVAKEMEPFYQAFGRGTDKKVASAEQTRTRRLADALERRVPVFEGAPILDVASAELRRLEASEAALIEALEEARVRCTSKNNDRFRELIARVKEARNG